MYQLKIKSAIVFHIALICMHFAVVSRRSCWSGTFLRLKLLLAWAVSEVCCIRELLQCEACHICSCPIENCSLFKHVE